ncbi:MAG TPA: PIN domain protein, partial [Deltaproteobacteria bacterium]|nr:PIN domain protein [Deltaproteobacteria bacterium]
RKEISVRQVEAVGKNLDGDHKSGVLRRVPVLWSEVFIQAMELSKKYSRKLGNRSLDILHIAIAIHLAAKVFLSFG